MNADRIEEAPALPSLATFAAERGLKEFSEAEQQEAFIEAYGPGTDDERRSRRARLIRRQLEALRWLERLVAQDPGADDHVSAWFEPALAARLDKARLKTLAELAVRVNGVGAVKAQRVVDWLRANAGSTGLVIGGHVAVPRSQLQASQLQSVTGRRWPARPLPTSAPFRW